MAQEDQIEIIEREHMYTLEIAVRISMLQFGSVISKAYAEIMKYMESINVECSDAPFVGYLDLDWDVLNKQSMLKMLIEVFSKKWNLRIGFPIREKAEGKDHIKSGELSACRCVKTIHKGPYQKVGDSYKKMSAWIKDNNIAVLPESLEIYLNDPRQTKKADLETIVLIPIRE